MPSPGRPGRATFALKPVSFLSSRTLGRVCPSPFCAVLRQICPFQKNKLSRKTVFPSRNLPFCAIFPGPAFPGTERPESKKEKTHPAFPETETPDHARQGTPPQWGRPTWSGFAYHATGPEWFRSASPDWYGRVRGNHQTREQHNATRCIYIFINVPIIYI